MTFPQILGTLNLVGALILFFTYAWVNKKKNEKWNSQQVGLIIKTTVVGILFFVAHYIFKYIFF